MTKKLVLYCFIIINFSLFSQQKKTYLGVEYLPAITTQLRPSTGHNNPLRFSSSFGINVRHELTPNSIYFETGIYSLDRGFGYSVDIFNQKGELFGRYKRNEVNYCLSLPIKVGFKFNDIFVELGPSFDYIYAKRIKHDKNIIDKTMPVETNRFLIGGILGFGTCIVPGYKKGMLITVGAYSNVTFKPIYLNAGLKLGVKIRIK